ncbi:helix-turn-helix domain-containing protein [Lentzea sp. NPDC051838]|uniref:helix-turn-helix domain-containing protein n=1 Tax=Lentzea sp. NPDC051838 TaxID=3154849 RepID=UPI00343E49C7
MNLLEPVGLGESDSATYFAVLDAQRAAVPEIAELAGLSVEAAAGALDRLVEAGLVTKLRTRPVLFVPAPPEVAVDAIVARRTHDLDDLLAASRELTHRLDKTFPAARTGMVEVVDGYDATSQRVAQSQLGAQEEVLLVDAPPYLDRTPMQNRQELKSLERGVSYRCVYDRSSLELPGHYEAMMECVRAGEQARTLTSVSMKMLIVDRKVAFVPMAFGDRETSSAFVVRASPLLDALLVCFESLWSRAVPLGADPVPGAGELSHRDQRLLALMASGMKDRAIARTLGITERTLSRHVHELMTALEADTRFQAGMQAFHRGWLSAPAKPHR